MSDWQPIATAPKDGTIVVVLVNERIYPDGRPTLAFWSNENRWWRELRANCVIATHWMPLPSPPRAGTVQPKQGPFTPSASAAP